MFEFGNRTSLTNIAHTFEDNDQPEGPSAKKKDDDDIPEMVDPEEHEDHALVQSKFIQTLGEEQQPRPKSGLKGISDLTLGECSILVTALSDTGVNRLHFKHIRESKDDVPKPPQQKAHYAPPSIHDSDGIKEVSGPSVEKPRPSCVWKKPEVVIMCARQSSKKIAVDSKSGDLSSVSGSEYQPGKGDANWFVWSCLPWCARGVRIGVH
ncbi:hypothetical protein BDN67DRAFT_983504 [Paxillus ammoniavirescens]|nr:hypothetical protein BDN67DRAFT_983504 [Paxillus ammoniavirescens]